MNGHLFSIIGYLGAALSLSVPLLWLAAWTRRRARLGYLALALSVAALGCAKVNSATHVRRIQALPSAATAEPTSPEERIRQAALEGRRGDVAQITFAEDGAGDFLDKAGMDEADLKYLGGAEQAGDPEWKRQKQARSAGAAADAAPEDKLTSQIDGSEAPTGVASEATPAPAEEAPILLPAAEVTTANRLDRLNLSGARLILMASLLLLVVDHLRRANDYVSASRPLRLPSAWLNAFAPQPALVVRPQPPRRTIPEELEWLARRGDSFVYLTDLPEASAAARAHLAALPPKRRPQVLHVADGPDAPDDTLVFETLWYGRGSFVVTPSRASTPCPMLSWIDSTNVTPRAPGWPRPCTSSGM